MNRLPVAFDFAVPRDSKKEITFAEINGTYLGRIHDDSKTADCIVMEAIQRAVKKWSKTEAGYEAMKDSVQDFNVGDLVGYLDTDRDLIRFLFEEGIVDLSIDCMSREDVASVWQYDTPLCPED